MNPLYPETYFTVTPEEKAQVELAKQRAKKRYRMKKKVKNFFKNKLVLNTLFYLFSASFVTVLIWLVVGIFWIIKSI